MVQLLFETFNVPACFFASESVASLFATGRTTGLVVSCSDTLTCITPIREGSRIQSAVVNLELGGRNLDGYLSKLLESQGWPWCRPLVANDIIRDIKQKLCYVAFDPVEEMKNELKLEKKYELPDGQFISLNTERFQCPEILFNPQLVEKNIDSIPKAIYASIMKCDRDIRQRLCNNIVLSGGTTMLPGFVERIKKELKVLFSDSIASLYIIAPSNRMYLPWLGASSLSVLKSFQCMWISKQEYDETGPTIWNKIPRDGNGLEA